MKMETFTRGLAYAGLPPEKQQEVQSGVTYISHQCAQIGIDPARLKRAPFVKDASGIPFVGMTKAELDAALVAALSTSDLRTVAAGRIAPIQLPEDAVLVDLVKAWLTGGTSSAAARAELTRLESQACATRTALTTKLSQMSDLRLQLALLENRATPEMLSEVSAALRGAVSAQAAHPFWVFVRLRAEGLVWRTRNSVVIADIDGRPHDVGVWWMLHKLDAGQLLFAPARNAKLEALGHPHILGTGAMCYGTGKSTVSECLARMAAFDTETVPQTLTRLLDTIAGLLCSYDSSSCYTKLPDCTRMLARPWSGPRAFADEGDPSSGEAEPEPDALGALPPEAPAPAAPVAPAAPAAATPAAVPPSEVMELLGRLAALWESLAVGADGECALPGWFPVAPLHNLGEPVYSRIRDLETYAQNVSRLTSGALTVATVGSVPPRTFVLTFAGAYAFRLQTWTNANLVEISSEFSLNFVFNTDAYQALRNRVLVAAAPAAAAPAAPAAAPAPAPTPAQDSFARARLTEMLTTTRWACDAWPMLTDTLQRGLTGAAPRATVGVHVKPELRRISFGLLTLRSYPTLGCEHRTVEIPGHGDAQVSLSVDELVERLALIEHLSLAGSVSPRPPPAAGDPALGAWTQLMSALGAGSADPEASYASLEPNEFRERAARVRELTLGMYKLWEHGTPHAGRWHTDWDGYELYHTPHTHAPRNCRLSLVPADPDDSGT